MIRRHFVISGLALACLVARDVSAAGKVGKGERKTTIQVTYGVVIDVEEVQVKSDAGKGAILGGLVGLAAGHDKSTKNQAGSAAVGAALGAIITRAAEGKLKANAFTVKKADGSTIKVIMDHAEIQNGDCVAVEEGKSSNIRQVSSEVCVDTSLHADEQVVESHVDDAEECQKAKDLLLEAEDDEAFARAEKKVKILCH